MFYTSYFANLKKLPDNVVPISICGKAPDWYSGLQYKKLAPKMGMQWEKPMLMKKHSISWSTFLVRPEIINF